MLKRPPITCRRTERPVAAVAVATIPFVALVVVCTAHLSLQSPFFWGFRWKQYHVQFQFRKRWREYSCLDRNSRTWTSPTKTVHRIYKLTKVLCLLRVRCTWECNTLHKSTYHGVKHAAISNASVTHPSPSPGSEKATISRSRNFESEIGPFVAARTSCHFLEGLHSWQLFVSVMPNSPNSLSSFLLLFNDLQPTWSYLGVLLCRKNSTQRPSQCCCNLWKSSHPTPIEI